MNGKFAFVCLFALLLLTPSLGLAEFGPGSPFTEIILTFVEGDVPQAGITVVMVDEDKKEWTGVSDRNGRVKFTIQATSGTAFVTYWRDGNAVLKKALPYHAGNHYNFRLEMAE